MPRSFGAAAGWGGFCLLLFYVFGVCPAPAASVTVAFGTSLEALSDSSLDFAHDGVKAFGLYVQFSEPVHMFDDWLILTSYRGSRLSVKALDAVTKHVNVTVAHDDTYELRISGAFVIAWSDNSALHTDYRIMIRFVKPPPPPPPPSPSFSNSNGGSTTGGGQ